MINCWFFRRSNFSDSIMQHYLHTCAVKMYAVSNFTRSAIYQPLGNTTFYCWSDQQISQTRLFADFLGVQSRPRPKTIFRKSLRLNQSARSAISHLVQDQPNAISILTPRIRSAQRSAQLSGFNRPAKNSKLESNDDVMLLLPYYD